MDNIKPEQFQLFWWIPMFAPHTYLREGNDAGFFTKMKHSCAKKAQNWIEVSRLPIKAEFIRIWIIPDYENIKRLIEFILVIYPIEYILIWEPIQNLLMLTHRHALILLHMSRYGQLFQAVFVEASLINSMLPTN